MPRQKVRDILGFRRLSPIADILGRGFHGNVRKSREKEVSVELAETKISKIRGLIESGKVSAVEICKSYLNSIEVHNPQFRAFIHYNPDLALAQAAQIDK